MADNEIRQLIAKREAMTLILESIARYLAEVTCCLTGTPTMNYVLEWQAAINAKVMELQAVIREEMTKAEILYLIDDLKSSAEASTKEEAGKNVELAEGISVGTKVSWLDHLGAWKGRVVSVHMDRVKKTVTNFQTWNDTNRDFEITRVGTDRDPMLYIEIESAEVDGEVVGKALRSLGSVTISPDK